MLLQHVYFWLHINPAGKIYKGIKARFWAAGNAAQSKQSF